MNFIVLSSSSGTTFQAVIDRMQDGSLTANCLGLITDKASRGCNDKAQDAGLPIQIVKRIKGESRDAYDQKIDQAIAELGGDEQTVIVCLGWMFILSSSFVNRHERKIINVHPALLPKHPGAHGIEDALAAGDTETGMTIHFVDEGVDTGEIIVQKSCSILPDDTVETLKPRIQELEKEEYPKVLEMIHRNTLS